MVKLDTDNSEEKSENEAQIRIDNLLQPLINLQTGLFTPELIESCSLLQNTVNNSNMASIVASASSMLAHQLAEAVKVSLPQVNINASYNNMLSSLHIEVVQNIANSVNKIIDGLQFDYSKLALDLGEILKNIPSPYSENEISEIISNVKRLAEQGWVIYYDFGDIYRRINIDNIEELEDEWLTQLKIDLSSEDIYSELKESLCYPETLIESMFESYKSKNYYGVLNRIAEQVTNKDRIPVGYPSVEVLEKQFVDKTFSDVGLIHWLFNFFKDTNRFTIEEPNRHMIGHGRWEGTISEKDFLKLFNVMLCLLANFELWQYHWVEVQ